MTKRHWFWLPGLLEHMFHSLQTVDLASSLARIALGRPGCPVLRLSGETSPHRLSHGPGRRAGQPGGRQPSDVHIYIEDTVSQ